MTKLERSMESDAGRLLRRAQHINFMCSIPLQIRPDEITCEEFTALMALRSESDRYQRDKSRRR